MARFDPASLRSGPYFFHVGSFRFTKAEAIAALVERLRAKEGELLARVAELQAEADGYTTAIARLEDELGHPLGGDRASGGG